MSETPVDPCWCDAFPRSVPYPHEAGLVIGETYCEQLYTQPTTSPHLLGTRPDGSQSRPWGWPLPPHGYLD